MTGRVEPCVVVLALVESADTFPALSKAETAYVYVVLAERFVSVYKAPDEVAIIVFGEQLPPVHLKRL
jgi:hypothetical protein